MPTNSKLFISAAALQKYSARHALSQDDLARMAGVSIQRIKQIEDTRNGKTGATVFPKTAKKLAYTLDVRVSELLGSEPQPKTVAR